LLSIKDDFYVTVSYTPFYGYVTEFDAGQTILDNGERSITKT